MSSKFYLISGIVSGIFSIISFAKYYTLTGVDLISEEDAKTKIKSKEIKVAIDVRDGDFLAMDVHEWHCNTKIHPIDKDYTRLSLVAYLREKMIKCKNDVKMN